MGPECIDRIAIALGGSGVGVWLVFGYHALLQREMPLNTRNILLVMPLIAAVGAVLGCVYQAWRVAM